MQWQFTLYEPEGQMNEAESRNYWLRKRLSRRRFVAGTGTAAVGAVGLSAVGCGNDDDDGNGGHGGETPSGNGSPSPTTGTDNGNGNGNGNGGAPSGALRVSLATLMDQSSDPRYQSGGLARPVNTSLFNGFFRRGDDAQREMDLAEGYEVSPDRMTMTFKMRPGLKFSDGSDVTIDDVVWSYSAWVDRSPPQPEAVILQGRVDSVEAVDDETCRVNLSEPTPFEGRESTWWNVSSQAYYDQVGEDEFRRSGIGTGPFKLVENVVGQYIAMEANPEHWDPEYRAKVQSVRLNVVPEQTTRISQIQAGETDIIDGVAGAQAQQLAQGAGINLVSAEATALLMFRFVEVQEGNAPWTDPRLREALVISIDQQSIVDGLLREGAPSPNVQLWPATLGYDEDLFPVRPFDPDRARELITEAGLEGFSFPINTYESSSYPLIPEVTQAIAGFWEAIGVSPTIVQGEAGGHFQSFVNREFDGVAVISWPFDPNAHTLVVNALRTGSPYGSFDGNEVIDDIADQILEEADTDRQIELAQQAHLEVYENFLMATAPWSDSLWVTTDKVTAWIRPAGEPYVTRLNSVELSS